MDTQLLKQLLDVQFYDTHKEKLSPDLFDGPILDLYEIITDAHKKYGADLTSEELAALWDAANPVATKAQKSAMRDVIAKVDHEDLMNADIAGDVINGLWQRHTGHRIAKLGINLAEGKEEAFGRLESLIEKAKAGFAPNNVGEDTTKDIFKLLEATSNANRFKFNLPVLHREVYGPMRGDFVIIHARPETGKTALANSFAFGPNGFAEQGAHVVYLCNEEKSERTMLRAFGSWTGMTEKEMRDVPILARDRFDRIRDKVTMHEIQDWHTGEVEAYLRDVKPDIVIVDQADKMTQQEKFDRDDLRLRGLYTWQRECAKRVDAAWFAVSQTGVDGDGKTIVLPSMMEGSRTGKFAEADLILGVGKWPEADDPVRFITCGKNKISGYHGTVTCKLDPFTTRYTD